MTSATNDRAIGFIGLGGNDTRVFGLDPATRARRFAVRAGLTPLDRAPADGAAIVADLGHAWDPAWFGWLADRPGTVVTLAGRPVLAHAPTGSGPAMMAAMTGRDALPPGIETRAAETIADLYNPGLRKREAAYLMPLVPGTARAVERASYDASYKGVTDLLTLYLWREAAFHLTRWAARAGISPNMVTMLGAVLCVAAFVLFRDGRYLAGLTVGIAFMVLDTVDGKLARCTGTSSRWGNILDHGIDLVHPPFWYWAWGAGLGHWGLGWSAEELWSVMAVLIAGYVVQRAIEGAFIAAFAMHIHVWRRADSRFRLVTARRNPNWLILLASLCIARPDLGLLAVAGWTVLSCLFHLVRLGQAHLHRARGQAIVSWLA